ncbi:hypothetical protein Sjap_004681 [Stephania japonica]|uniref:Uncharacterized protein n=1 Tax=Stephania japonica TaxID=461633 RepID=A0AAP0K2N0_9MAGN
MTAGDTTTVANIPATLNPPPTAEHTWRHLSYFFTNCGVGFCPVSCNFATAGLSGWAAPPLLIAVIWRNVGDSSKRMWVPPNPWSKVHAALPENGGKPSSKDVFGIVQRALGYEFDNDQFHAYVHGRLPYENLKPDPTLKNLLLSMPQRRIIFTNADKAHAAQVLKRLGLEDCFQGIICFETLNSPSLECNEIYKNMNKNLPSSDNYADDDPERSTEFALCNRSGSQSPRILCKPSLEAIEAAIQIANADPSKTIFFDDSARNIASAKIAGLRTVVVGSTVVVPGADLALGSIHNMKEALPEIWEGQDQETQEQVLRSTTAVETTVLA